MRVCEVESARINVWFAKTLGARGQRHNRIHSTKSKLVSVYFGLQSWMDMLLIIWQDFVRKTNTVRTTIPARTVYSVILAFIRGLPWEGSRLNSARTAFAMGLSLASIGSTTVPLRTPYGRGARPSFSNTKAEPERQGDQAIHAIDETNKECSVG
jgi:hypothetical protein